MSVVVPRGRCSQFQPEMWILIGTTGGFLKLNLRILPENDSL